MISWAVRFFAFFQRPSPWSFGILFYSILGTTRIASKSLRIQNFASGTVIYFACFDVFAGFEMQFWGFNWNLHATYQLNQPIWRNLWSKFPKFNCFIAQLFIDKIPWNFYTLAFMGWYMCSSFSCWLKMHTF